MGPYLWVSHKGGQKEGEVPFLEGVWEVDPFLPVKSFSSEDSAFPLHVLLALGSRWCAEVYCCHQHC